jgi:malonyl-CoA/methylmalonyl-CoA synthetase
MAGPTAEYTVGMFAAWLAGGVAVPLCLSNPPVELEYNITHSSITTVLASEEYIALLTPLCEKTGTTLIEIEKLVPGAGAAEVDLGKLKMETGALIIYTSGTTGRPKGALHTHAGLGAQCRSLSEAWQWHSSDRIFHALPLHHIHGIVNAWLCCVFNGALVEFYPKFSPSALWGRAQEEPPLTIFMGVPTMYSFLISAYDKMTPEAQASAVGGVKKFRLMISGSAACPVIPLHIRSLIFIGASPHLELLHIRRPIFSGACLSPHVKLLHIRRPLFWGACLY